MGETVVQQSEAVAWVQSQGPSTAFLPFAVGEDGMALTGKTIPVVNLAPVYARDRNGKPVVIAINETAPGDLPTLTATIFEKASQTILEEMWQRKCPINLQLRLVECGVLDNPFVWDKLLHWSRGQLTTYSPGDGPSLEFDGTQMQASGALSFRGVVLVLRTGLSSLTVSTEINDGLAIDGIPDEDCNECGTGYPGADKILVVGAEPTAVAQPKAYISGNGGGTFISFTTDPFAADEDVAFVQLALLGDNVVRVMLGTAITDVAKNAQYNYADVTFGDLVTVASWNAKELTGGGSTGDVLTAMLWAKHDRLYFATDAFEIYVEEQQGEDGTSVPVYTGAVAVNAFALSPDGRTVWAAGDTNFIARERNATGVFEIRSGPAAGVDFSAVAEADDGTLAAGNVQSLYLSPDAAGEAGNWSLKKDFGAGFTVTSIHFVKGDSQIIRVAASSASLGQVWESIDGGNSWRKITERTNLGYTGAYWSDVDANEAWIVGKADAGPNLVLHYLAPNL
jgi:hypothetical protein